jgi:hypothetical protein
MYVPTSGTASLTGQGTIPIKSEASNRQQAIKPFKLKGQGIKLGMMFREALIRSSLFAPYPLLLHRLKFSP